MKTPIINSVEIYLQTLLETKYKEKLGLIGKKISDLINQDGDEKTDGQVVDEIVDLLKFYNIYHPRK